MSIAKVSTSKQSPQEYYDSLSPEQKAVYFKLRFSENKGKTYADGVTDLFDRLFGNMPITDNDDITIKETACRVATALIVSEVKRRTGITFKSSSEIPA